MFLATIIGRETYHYDLTNVLGLHYFTSSMFEPYQLVTHMFMHENFMHIFSNMLALWMFGAMVENVWGPRRFLIFYFVCGLGGALCYLAVTSFQVAAVQHEVNQYASHPGIQAFFDLVKKHREWYGDNGTFINDVNSLLASWRDNPDDSGMASHSIKLAQEIVTQFVNIPVIGASGAVFGVLLAFGMMFPNTYIYLYFFVPVKAKYFVIFYGLFELYAGVTGTEEGVAHFAHIGGMIFGFFLIRYWNRKIGRNFF
jgi:membrane associated rhomboid family serine protease